MFGKPVNGKEMSKKEKEIGRKSQCLRIILRVGWAHATQQGAKQVRNGWTKWRVVATCVDRGLGQSGTAGVLKPAR